MSAEGADVRSRVGKLAERSGEIDPSYEGLAAGIIGVAPMIVLVLDRNGAIEFVNPFFEELTGYELSEVRGKEWFSTFLPERDREPIRAFFKETLAGTVMRGNVNPILTRSGEERDIEWHGRILDDGAGGITLVSFGKDVTEKLRAERSLQETERLFINAFDNTFDVHVLARVEPGDTFRTVSVNRRYMESIRAAGFSFSKEELIGETSRQVMARFGASPEEIDNEVRAMCSAVSSKQPVNFQRSYALGENLIHADVCVSPVIDDTGNCTHVLWTLRDITEQLRSAELLQTVVKAAPMNVYAFDLEGVFTLLDGGVVQQLDLSQDEMLGRSAFELFDDPHLRVAFDKAKAGEIARLPSELGGYHFESLLAPQRNSDGRIVGIVGATLDVTERHTIEKELAEQLEDKEVLLREIHHRVKNNLQMVSSLLYLQQKNTQSDEVERILVETRARVLAMALVHEQLYSSSSGVGRVGLVAYAKELCRSLFATFGVDNSRIELEVSGQPIAANIERALPLGLILNEVVSNSLKHAFPQGRSGRIEVEFRDLQGHLEMRLSDNGVGMNPDDDGSTLGLRLIRRLAAQLEGQLDVVSDSGGTRYSLAISLTQ